MHLRPGNENFAFEEPFLAVEGEAAPADVEAVVSGAQLPLVFVLAALKKRTRI